MKSIGVWIVACFALALAACMGLGGPRTVTFDEGQIGAMLSRQFPVQRRVLELFDLEIAAPSLKLKPERNRLVGDFALVSTDRLSRRPVRGRLVLESALRYEPSDQSVRLVQVRVQQVELEAVSPSGGPSLPPAAQRAAGALAEQLLEDFAIYRIPPQRIEALRAAGYRPGAVTVTARGVEVTFERVGSSQTP